MKDEELIAAILKDDYVNIRSIPIYLPKAPGAQILSERGVPKEYQYTGCRYIFQYSKGRDSINIDYNTLYKDNVGDVFVVDEIVELTQPYSTIVAGKPGSKDWKFVHFKQLLEDYERRQIK